MQEQIVQWILAGSWLAISAFLVGAIVRAVKAGWWPKALRVAPKYRELVALCLGTLSGALETAAAGTPWKEALARGVVSGAIAIVGHHVFIDWLRGGRELGSEVVKTTSFLALLLTLGACGVLKDLLPAALDAAAAGSRSYFARHPNAAAEDLVRQHELDAQLARADLAACRAAGEDDTAAKAKAVEKYRALLELLDELGVTTARAPAGGAETETAEPVPFSLPAPESIAEAL